MLCLLTLWFAPPPQAEPDLSPSSYATSEAGAKAAFLLLGAAGIPAERWEQSPAALHDLDSHGVLILAEPNVQPQPYERAALRDFVERGGRVLFCGGQIDEFFGHAIDHAADGAEWREVPVSTDRSPYVFDVRRVILQPAQHWGRIDAGQSALFGDAQGSLGIEWHMGKGTVVWWAKATPLTNAGIQKADNLQLFLNAVSMGSQQPPRVYWDEYFHGMRASLWSFANRTPLRILPFQLLLLGLLSVFGWSRRWGPLQVPYIDARLAPLEFVDMLGGVYQRARATNVALVVERDYLRLTLARVLGLSTQLPDEALCAAAVQRFPSERSTIEEALLSARVDGASRAKPADVLRIVQRMTRFAAMLSAGKRAQAERATA